MVSEKVKIFWWLASAWQKSMHWEAKEKSTEAIFLEISESRKWRSRPEIHVASLAAPIPMRPLCTWGALVKLVICMSSGHLKRHAPMKTSYQPHANGCCRNNYLEGGHACRFVRALHNPNWALTGRHACLYTSQANGRTISPRQLSWPGTLFHPITCFQCSGKLGKIMIKLFPIPLMFVFLYYIWPEP